MTDEAVTTQERIARSMVSGNLQQREHRCDLDYVTAAGMVAQQHGEAMAVLRYHLLGDATSFKSVRSASISIARRLNTKRDWRLTAGDVVRIADIAVRLYLMPKCPKCQGRKFQRVAGTPSLSNRICPKCHGTGNRAAPDKNGDQIRAVVQVLTSIVELASSAIRRKVKHHEY